MSKTSIIGEAQLPLLYSESVNTVAAGTGTDANDENSNGSAVAATVTNSRNYMLTAANIPSPGVKTKLNDNIAAIRTLLTLERERRNATTDEQCMLARFSGFGATPQVFADSNNEWSEASAELKSILGDKEFESARASILNAHYTPFGIVRFIYAALQRLGFRGGLILEPALGTGHFIGLMPESLAANSTLFGIEIDDLSARIAQRLYPDAVIQHKGFETVSMDDGSFDVAVGNVPFGDFTVYDREYDKLKLSIHDYFLCKSIDKVRPGGLLAMITSRWTMDKKDARAREYMASKADLVAAVRLPDSAFRETANTSVTTDIIILRKRDKDGSSNGKQWNNLSQIHLSSDRGGDISLNEYFASHRYMVLGDLELESTQYGSALTVKSNSVLEVALDGVLGSLPSDVYSERVVSDTDSDGEAVSNPLQRGIPAPEDVKPGAYVISEGVVCRREGDNLQPIKLSAKVFDRIEGLIDVRDSVRRLLNLQQQKESQVSDIEEATAILNETYDRVTKKFGVMSDRSNSAAFRDDPDYPLLLALEVMDPATGKLSKAEIFTKRVIYPEVHVTNVNNAEEALAVSLNLYGNVDLHYMGGLLGFDEQRLVEELGDKLYRNPTTSLWEPSDKYLSGNVREKLQEAIKAASSDSTYERNVKALESAQPAPLKRADIDANLGASWIPEMFVADFIAHIVQVPDCAVVKHAVKLGLWSVRIENAKKAQVEGSVSNNRTYGTIRNSAVELIAMGLNQQMPTVYDIDRNGKRFFNERETVAVREKLHNIREEFSRWIWSAPARQSLLVDIYNENFNSTRPRIYDGSHLTLPGSSDLINLRKAQKNSVWRILNPDNTLLWQDVGFGKTFTMIASAMELRRLGLASKPMFVVPNHLIPQWSSQFLRLYPWAKLLVASREDSDKARRKRICASMATGDWDAVIVPYSIFERLPVLPDTEVKYLYGQLNDIMEAMAYLYGKDPESLRSRKILEKKRIDLKSRIDRLMRDGRKDDGICFEELGVDFLFIDESDSFKSLAFATKMGNVAGLSRNESKRAFDLYIKSQYLNERFGENRMVFATATPISNTLAELYTVQRYLQPKALRRNMVYHFDAWAAHFAQVVAVLEITPDCGGLRVNNRFARFCNLGDLMTIFDEVADVPSDSDLAEIEKPSIRGGKPQIVTSPASPELEDYIGSLVHRVELIKNGRVQPKEDNMLAVTVDGRKAALDIRLVMPLAPDYPDSKVNKASRNIYDIWEETKASRLTQMVFMDLSTPQAGWNLYEEMRAKLVAMGIPKAEIVFMHEAKTDLDRAKLFEDVRCGMVRILFGSTEMMGAGTDVQTLLVAMHELTVPWRPRDLSQRAGRIIRQGNLNPEVRLYQYITEGSFDAFIWQALETKARFITQATVAGRSVRRAEDIDALILTYAEVKAIASGNPMLIEKYKVELDLRTYRTLKQQYNEMRFDMQRELVDLPGRIELLKRRISAARADMSLIRPTDSFEMTISGVSYDDRDHAGRALARFISALPHGGDEMQAGTFGPFGVYVRPDTHPHVILKGNGEYVHKWSKSGRQAVRNIEQTVADLESTVARWSNLVSVNEKRLKDIASEVDRLFQHDEKIFALESRLQELLSVMDRTKDQAGTGVLEGTIEIEEAA